MNFVPKKWNIGGDGGVDNDAVDGARSASSATWGRRDGWARCGAWRSLIIPRGNTVASGDVGGVWCGVGGFALLVNA